jgi:hypothetical protein
MNMILQVIISVIVVYLIFSVIVYVIVEGISSLLQLRGKTLLNALNRLIGNSELRGVLYEHPQISKIRRDQRLPAYIPSSNVALAIIDLVKDDNTAQPTPGAASPHTSAVFNAYQIGLSKIADKDLKRLLQTVTDHTADLKELSDALEKWYNEYMDRVTGWYKKKIRNVVISVAVLVTLAFNVDSLHVIHEASTDPVLRERLNLLADQVLEDSLIKAKVDAARTKPMPVPEMVDSSGPLNQDSLNAVLAIHREEFQTLKQRTASWNLPVGRKIIFGEIGWQALLGWVITVFALSAGAPFWFDLLKRVVNLRNTGLKPSGTTAADQRK